jgi:hypothetical protein
VHGKGQIDNAEQAKRLICVESDHREGEGAEAMFDSGGQPGEKWRNIERLLSEYEADLDI